MLSVRLIKKLEGISKCSRNGHKVRKLFNIITNNPELWRYAYANIYPNKGAMTKGVDDTTIDGFSDERVANIIRQLREGKYRFQIAIMEKVDVFRGGERSALKGACCVPRKGYACAHAV